MLKPEFTFRYKVRNWHAYNRALALSQGLACEWSGHALGRSDEHDQLQVPSVSGRNRPARRVALL
jgi:hypothetical protein